jgi:hypothetical protein
MHRLLPALLAAGALTFFATDARGQAPKAVNVCELLPQAEVETFVGEKLRRSPRVSGNDLMTVRSDTCHYRSPGWIISANIERGRDAAAARKYLDTFRKVSGKETGAKSVSGLGDDGWWTTTDANSGMLVVARKGDVLTLSTSGTGAGAGSYEKTEALMKKLLAAYVK